MLKTLYRLFFFLWLCPAAAHAIADPSDIFQPYISETITYNDNLFYRSSSPNATPLPSGASRDDVINQATVGSAANYTLGRQKFTLNLSVSDLSFANNKFLDNIASNDRAVWQWQFGRQLSGEVGYAYTRAMGGFTNTTFIGLNMITGNNVFANLSYTWHPRWKALTSLSWQSYTNGASQWTANDQQYTTAVASLNYTTPSNNSFGLECSFISGKYPNRQLDGATLVDNKYQQYNSNVLLTWKISEKTSFSGKVGYIARLYPDYSQRDFGGETYDLALNWTPTAKTMLAFSTWRRLATWTDVTASYVLTEGFSVSPMWQVSTKLSLTAKFSRQTLDYTGDQIVQGIPTRQDTVMNGQVSLIYTPVPNVEVTLSYLAGKRDTINPNPPLNNQPLDYLVNSLFSSIVLKF